MNPIDDDDDDDDEPTSGDKHRALVDAGWTPTSNFQGVLTKYLPPGQETGAMVQLYAYEKLTAPTLN